MDCLGTAMSKGGVFEICGPSMLVLEMLGGEGEAKSAEPELEVLEGSVTSNYDEAEQKKV